MNTSSENTQTSRPIGFWITAVDRLLADRFATAFRNEGITRRDWRALNAIDGTVDTPHALRPHKLERLLRRGWVTQTDDQWQLTENGRDAKERLGAVVDGIRAQVIDAVSPEEYETTVATLEKIARSFGYEEGSRLPRGRKHMHRHGCGRGQGHGHDRGHGYGFRHGHAHGERPQHIHIHLAK